MTRDRADSTESLPNVTYVSLMIETDDGKKSTIEIPAGNTIRVKSEISYRESRELQLSDLEYEQSRSTRQFTERAIGQKLKITIEASQGNSQSPLVVFRNNG